MNNEIYYPKDLSSENYLQVCGSIIRHSKSIQNGKSQLIECNKKENTMKVKEKNNNEGEFHEINTNNLVNGGEIYFDDRSRWEGSTNNGLPYGFGCMYNSENKLIYQGFMYEGMKVCFGTEFYVESGTVQYSGEFYDNMKFGYGEQFRVNSKPEFCGDWFKDQPIRETTLQMNDHFNENAIHYDLKELKIGDKCHCSISDLNIVHYNNLEKLDVGNNVTSDNWNNVRIMHCNHLKEVILGDNSINNKFGGQRNNSSFIIMNCAELNQIYIGKKSLNCFWGLFHLCSMVLV